ncbi:MAG TPA: response regulator, partial [Candidatus Cloacimonadota bacterium]|nr:response regulator [Candidatus Cloacimonadota bacterium]
MKKRLNVLWVDDEIELLEAFIIFLKEKNVNVISATNGDDAIVLFVNNQIDLIILDEIMPGMDGLSVLAEISKINAEVPVIML